MSGSHGAGRRELPPFLSFLEQRLDARTRQHEAVLGLDVYEVDLSELKLRFSDRTPLILVKATDLAELGDVAAAEIVDEVLRVRNLTERHPLIVVEGSGDAMRRYVKLNHIPAVVLDAADEQEIMESRRAQAELLDHIVSQMSLVLLSPYEINKPVTGSRFFGRESQVRQLLYSGDTNFAVMGIRRIGKTSLLREAARRMRERVLDSENEDAGKRIFFMDCSTLRTSDELMREVIRHYYPHDLMRLENRQFPLFFPDFLRRMARRYEGQLVLLLDEFDVLLNADLNNEPLLNVLRTASNEGHCRFIIAGFRDLLEQSARLQSPLFNFAKPMRLKEFSREEAGRMILGPLLNLRVRVERENEVVDRIFAETAGQPHLIQFYCSYLIDRLDHTDSRRLAPEDLLGIYEDENFRAFILNTFMDNTTRREKAIVFSLVLKLGDKVEPFDLEDIETALLAQQIDVLLDDLERACRNLELAGTFTKQGRNYRFSIPIFPEMLTRNYNAAHLLSKIQREGI
jgi:Cdc6-like AAA superfamily ATPase